MQPDTEALSHSRFPRRRPLDAFASFKVKLGVLVTASVVVAAVVVSLGSRSGLSPLVTVPVAILVALVVTLFLSRGMVRPLREMTSAAVAMSRGDYSRRIRASSRDEIGELATAFNRMARELATIDVQRRELVANVSHELRTPVAALQAQLENLVDGVTEPDPASLTIALNETERLGRLVSQLLDLSRLEAGALPFEPETLPVVDFLSDATDAAALVATNSNRDVRYAIAVEPRDLTMFADPARLHQVLANLLDNATRFSPSGGTVTARAMRGRSSLVNTLVLEVSDEGPGIPPVDRERVFQRFHRGGTASGEALAGTGLGLAIARWAIELHDGAIDVVDSSSPGGAASGLVPGGTTIRVVIPQFGFEG